MKSNTTFCAHRRQLSLGLVLATALGTPWAQTRIDVKPQGEYARIDVQLANDTVDQLLGSDAQARQRAVAKVQDQPQRYAPPVFYALSEALLAQKEPERAMFWFYAGQLRGRFDANRCADVSARAAIGALNERFGRPVNRFAFQNLELLKKTVSEVVEWDRKTPHDYDHRWINLHGMGAFGAQTGGAALSLPRAQWPAIAEQTRQDYLNGFQAALEQM